MDKIDSTESLGYPTERGLFDKDSGNPDEMVWASGELSVLGLHKDDLRNRRVLDVGIGAGISFREAMELMRDDPGFGLDYQAIDILPVVDTRLMSPRHDERVELDRRSLMQIAVKYPDRFKIADATKHLPYKDQEFDLVMACMSVPIYARNSRDAINSVLEMIRVSKTKVAFNIDFDGNWVSTIGDPFSEFRMKFRDVLDRFKTVGIGWTFVDAGASTAVHVDLSKIDREKFRSLGVELIGNASSFVVKTPQRNIVLP